MSKKTIINQYYQGRPQYGLGHAIFDIFMIVITCGFWLIWVAVRYLRTH